MSPERREVTHVAAGAADRKELDSGWQGRPIRCPMAPLDAMLSRIGSLAVPRAAALSLVLVGAAIGCKTIGPAYPPRPPATPGEPVTDPEPSRIVVHATIAGAAIERAIEEALPKSGEGTFPLLGSERRYTYRREPARLRFMQGRIGVDLHVVATADLPVGSLDLPFDLRILAEPVLTPEYVARLQSTEVQASSDAKATRFADAAAGVLEKVRREVLARLDAFEYDARPLVEEAYARLAAPIDLPLGDAQGCAALNPMGIEAGPTVLADGIEKDFALIVAPTVTLPCATWGPPSPMPPLANVAAVPSGPFTVMLSIAARYDELARAMSLAFTDGKYYFSKEHPGVYLEKPEVYAAHDKLVVKLRVSGPVEKLGFDTMLDGDIFFTGHPVVEDNEIRVPDLEPTIETSNFFLKLKAWIDSGAIRDQARAALRLDIGERLRAARDELTKDLSVGDEKGCLRADVTRVAVTGIHPHGSYLRLAVSLTGKATAHVPCPR